MEKTSPPPRTRNTQQRKAVLRAAHTLIGQHPTAADIYAEVRREQPQMSLATVYRALHALVAQDALTEMRVENVARYDVMGDATGSAAPTHHHVVCRRCGAVQDVQADALPDAALRQIERRLALASGFAVELHPIQFSGLCPACRS